MPVFKGVEVWIEDSQHRKLHYQEVSINLVDDRTVTVKTEMFRDELYTVHCLSPLSVFCDAFVINSSKLIRKHGARFCLNKAIATSKDILGSSEHHTLGQFQERGLRTPKKQFQQGKLGSVEVEIRRIGEIIKGEPREECEADGDEGVVTDVCMIDDFAQLPWLLFRFDIGVKEPPKVPASTAKCIKRPAARKTLRDYRQVTKWSQSGGSMTEGPSSEASWETNQERLPNFKIQHRRDGSVGVDDNKVHNSDRLQKEYQKAEAEERRLLRMLQQRLQAKKTRNKELRRLLGENS